MLGESFEDGQRALAFFGEGKSVPTVSVFGSSRLPEQDPACRMARIFGENMASSGIRLLAGGQEGLMGQALAGAREFGVALNWQRGGSPDTPPGTNELRFLHLSMRKRFSCGLPAPWFFFREGTERWTSSSSSWPCDRPSRGPVFRRFAWTSPGALSGDLSGKRWPGLSGRLLFWIRRPNVRCLF